MTHKINFEVASERATVAQLPEHQKKDTIEMLKRSVAEKGRTLGL